VHGRTYCPCPQRCSECQVSCHSQRREALFPSMAVLAEADLPVNLFCCLKKAFCQAAAIWAMCGEHSTCDTSSTTVISGLSCPALFSEVSQILLATAAGQLSISRGPDTMAQMRSSLLLLQNSCARPSQFSLRASTSSLSFKI